MAYLPVPLAIAKRHWKTNSDSEGKDQGQGQGRRGEEEDRTEERDSQRAWP